MKKRVLAMVLMFSFVLVLSGCWQAEVKVDTTINTDGSGTRSYIVSVYDDSLSDDPITNPDDPDGSEGKGAVLNDKHIDGGVEAIQPWLEDNAPSWMTVEEMETEGLQRIFTLTYDFVDFEDFLAKNEELINLSPTISWEDFTAEELPMYECEGTFTKTCTFTEQTATVKASMDWALVGIWEDIYLEADLAGYVGKDDIAVLSDYVLDLNGTEVEELHAYDPDAADGEGTGATVYVESESFTAETSFTNVTAVVLSIVGAVVVIGGAAAFFVFRPKA